MKRRAMSTSDDEGTIGVPSDPGLSVSTIGSPSKTISLEATTSGSDPGSSLERLHASPLALWSLMTV